MSNLRDLVRAAAVRELGVREEGGNNLGRRVRFYQQQTWLAPGAWPWCAAFAAYCLKQGLLDAGVDAKRAEAWRCRDASAFGWLGWAQKTPGALVLPANHPDLWGGDFPVYDFNGPTAAGGGHIGVLDHDIPGDGFYAIEGNTNDVGERDSDRGDGVLLKQRGGRSVIGFIRLPERVA